MDLSTAKQPLYHFIRWFYLINALIFCLLGYHYLIAILYSGSLFENSIIIKTSIYTKCFILAFALINYVSYMALLAWLPGIASLLLLGLTSRRRLIIGFSLISTIISVIFLMIDSQVFSMFKLHLNSTILSLIVSKSNLSVFDFSSYELIIIGLILLLVVCCEILLAYWVWKNATKKLLPNSNQLLIILGVGFIFSYCSLVISISNHNNLLSQQTPNLPLFNSIMSFLIPDKEAKDILTRYSESLFAQPMFAANPLNYPRHPMQCTPPPTPYNIILIMVDSLRADKLNAHFMPNLNQFSQQSWLFLNHYSGGNATQPGLFSLFYSLPSNYWTAMLEQKRGPILLELLKQNDYHTQVIWSSEMEVPPFRKTIYLPIQDNALASNLNSDIGSSDRQVTQLALAFLEKHQDSRQQPFFLNLFYDAAHGFCSRQNYPLRYSVNQKWCSRIALTNDVDPKPYYLRYLNAVDFIDKEIAILLKNIEKKGYLDNSIVIITSDHGQEFNETKLNYWGHSSNFTHYQVQVPLVIHWPHKKAAQFQYFTTAYDLVPTLLNHFIPCKNPIRDYSIGQDLLEKKGRLPFELVGSYTNMGIIEPDRITILHTSGQIAITDSEGHPLPTERPKQDIIQQVMKLMRHYFI